MQLALFCVVPFIWGSYAAPQSTVNSFPIKTNTSSSAPSNDCVSGKTYLVKSGENATVISKAQNVSTRAIIHINGLKPDGSDLIADSSICLPLTCPTYSVPQGSSCNEVATTAGISLYAFKQYNPDIDGKCNNLLADSNVCVGPLQEADDVGEGEEGGD